MVKMDSKGRTRIPPEMREGLGGTVEPKNTPKGIIVSPAEESPEFLEEYRTTLLSDPPKTGQPENWSSERIKAIWK
ncbi:MAG: AbrB/MazE/SpoVT family DNA-binding domain-containing protein [Candidatus Methanosuratincola sp.]